MVSSDALDSFRWTGLKELLSPTLYSALVRTTASRFVSVRGDYLKAAEKVRELIGDESLALNYLTNMLVRHFLKSQTFLP